MVALYIIRKCYATFLPFSLPVPVGSLTLTLANDKLSVLPLSYHRCPIIKIIKSVCRIKRSRLLCKNLIQTLCSIGLSVQQVFLPLLVE